MILLLFLALRALPGEITQATANRHAEVCINPAIDPKEWMRLGKTKLGKAKAQHATRKQLEEAWSELSGVSEFEFDASAPSDIRDVEYLILHEEGAVAIHMTRLRGYVGYHVNPNDNFRQLGEPWADGEACAPMRDGLHPAFAVRGMTAKDLGAAFIRIDLNERQLTSWLRWKSNEYKLQPPEWSGKRALAARMFRLGDRITAALITWEGETCEKAYTLIELEDDDKSQELLQSFYDCDS